MTWFVDRLSYFYRTLNKLYENELKERGKSHAHQQLKLFIDSVEKNKENGEIKPDYANRLINVAMAASEHPRSICACLRFSPQIVF